MKIKRLLSVLVLDFLELLKIQLPLHDFLVVKLDWRTEKETLALSKRDLFVFFNFNGVFSVHFMLV